MPLCEVEGVAVAVGAHHGAGGVDPEGHGGRRSVDVQPIDRPGFQRVDGEVVKVPVVVDVNPTEVPEFEIPFMFVPAPALVPAFGPSKLVKVKPSLLT